MIWKTLAFMGFTVLLQWKPTYGELLDCTPSMANRSVWLSSFGTYKNISNPSSFSSNVSVFCSWKVYVPNGFRIRVHFNSFVVKNSSNCSQAAVEVAEKQGDIIDTVLGRYCGSILPDDVVSTFSFVTVIYTASSGSTQAHPGFHASLSLAPAERCSPNHTPEANKNIVLIGTNSTINSPLLLPAHNLECRWTITVPSGHRIKLSFSVFHLGAGATEAQADCDKGDHVKVRDGNNGNDPAVGIFCGNEVPSPIYSVGPKIEITFVSNGDKVLRAFSARFESISGGVCTPGNGIVQLNLTQNSTGRLSSPDYPLQYPSVSGCYWRLQAPHGYQIKLHFTTLNIEGDCKEDLNEGGLVRVDDYFVTEFGRVSSFWGKFCRGATPPLIYSTKNELQVFFTSNYTSIRDFKSDRQADPNEGFYATYEVTPQPGYTSRCRTDVSPGKPIKVNGNTGSLVSPGYPNSYPIITCTWSIVVPNGYIVEMNIKDFEIDCAGGSDLQVGKDHFCGSKKPSGLLTSESDLEIKMISKVAQNNRGFRATFSMTKKEVDVASIVPWIVIPVVVVAICVTMIVAWRRQTAAGRGRRGSSFKSSIITRMRTQSTVSQSSRA